MNWCQRDFADFHFNDSHLAWCVTNMRSSIIIRGALLPTPSHVLAWLFLASCFLFKFFPVLSSFTLRSRLSSRFTSGREGEGRIRDATRCHANARPAKYAINLALAWGHLCMCVCVWKEKGFAVICLSEALTAFTYCAADALTLDTKANTTI